MLLKSFISYAHVAGTAEAELVPWLYDRLKQPDSPLDPVIDREDLVLGRWREGIDALVPLCHLMLVVWSPAWDARPECQHELHLAVDNGLSIVRLNVTAAAGYSDRLSEFSSHTFDGDWETAVQRLFRRARRGEEPLHRAQLMRQELSDLVSRADRPGFAEHDRIVELRTQQQLDREQERRRKYRIRAEFTTTGPTAVSTRAFLNRDDERRLLLTALRRHRGELVVVSGDHGIGKTRMVHAVLDELRVSAPELRQQRAQVHSPYSFVAGDLVAMLEGLLSRDDTSRRLDYRPRDPAAVKLKTLLEIPDTAPALVVLDSAELLLDQHDRRFRDSDLDEALQLLYGPTAPQHHVSVVLVTRVMPASMADWPARINTVPIRDGLKVDDFKKLLRQFDLDGEWFPDDRAEPGEALHRGTGGFPRAAELTFGLFENGTGEYASIDDVLDLIGSRAASKVPQLLLGELVDCLGADRLRVAAAVAVFGTPVTIEDVLAMLPGQAENRVLHTLRQLVTKKVVQRVGDSYLVQPPDNERILDKLGTDRRTLLLRAAAYLAARSPAEVHNVKDLELRRQQVDLLLRAEAYEEALEAVDELDRRYLYDWGYFSLLTGQREALRDVLTDLDHQIVNLNALGRSYTARFRYDEGIATFHMALDRAQRLRSPQRIKTLTVNLASAYFDSGDAISAQGHYERALVMARRFRDPSEVITPLNGLASCHRRHGKFQRSLNALDEAIGVAVAAGRTDRLAELLLNAGRCRLHLDERHAAEADFEHAGEHIDRLANKKQVRCKYLDATADLWLRNGQTGLAIGQATEAVDLALDLGDSSVLQQARTTLAAAHVTAGDLGKARDEITLAANYRPERRALIILAFQGLIEWRISTRQRDSVEYFQRLRREAVERRRSDPEDFGAWGMEGLAICGLHVCGGGPLTGAEEAVRASLRLTANAAGVAAQLRRMLEMLVAGGSSDELRRLVRKLRLD
ncbi:hypothetical protein GCM10010399_75490 [Dactylosporangium fulvum]|uniref:Toll/interleukin-1 receptor domain-containing protein n=1 Tax=Dactylosporangium fulvum TaxID=53359 RepID=A0ABY5VQT8_9ACTN|nr:toll/interleukin-1 receptor domain-containing protein [Dactylosporangium fulvum]UWP79171.1 toll/interleukin-1 receptor domain-containing protein [Dactylosporangium fulvum]